MKSQTIVRLFLILLCFLSASALFAQQTTGSLHGVATDPSGARVVKAAVILLAADGTTSTVETGADGAYTFPQLAPGTYTLNVTAKGLALAEAQTVTIVAGRATAQNLALSIAV